MEKVWICLVLLSVGASAFDQQSEYEYDDDYEVWDENVLQEALKENYDKVDETDNASLDVIKDDKNVEEDIEHFYQDYDKAVDALNADYQIEDNRSVPKEDANEEIPDTPADQSLQGEDEIATDIREFKEAAEFTSEEEAEKTADLADLADSDKEKNIQEIADELPNLEEHQDDKIMNFVAENDTGILYNPQPEEISFDVNSDLKPLPLPLQMNIEEIDSKIEENGSLNNFNDNKHIEETKKILEDLDNESTENNGFAQEAEKDAMQLNNLKDESELNDAIAEDTVDQVYDDLIDDLDKLSRTWKKLSAGETLGENNADDSINPDNVQEYEDKYNRPFREEDVLSLRDDYYEDIANHEEGLNYKDITEKDAGDTISLILEKVKNEADNIFKQEEDINDEDDVSDFNDSVVDSDDFNNLEEKITDANADDGILKDDIPRESVDVQSKDTEIHDTDKLAFNIDTDKSQSVDDNDEFSNVEPILYLKDAIVPNEDDQSNEQVQTTQQSEKQVTRTIDVSELNPEQYYQLMEQFRALHEDDLDVHSDSFGKNVAVQHVTLSLDDPVVIESPNYPSQYPTNNVIDWIFEGDGVGIELNITDFSVNGFFGDYLLVKPGGVDETGHDGLVFSYRLNEPRRYRFLDVSRMFVRFNAQPGNAFFTGFQYSVKMVAPLPQVEEILPEPEAVMPEPKETITLVLGGMDTIHFSSIQEQFRLLVADMATLYINANDIDPGSNTTYETTQITNIAVCNINWPDFENCAEVTFAVPVVYDDDEGNYDPRLSAKELKTMWQTYRSQDPFAARLVRMGLTEFTSPNDSNVLKVWLVLSLGVLVCMAMLAFALWRYSCGDTYTRMPEFSNPDNGYNEKQALDLYPTPHQTLPPLYESDYKWADVKYQDPTSDMGGFANRSFTRDELFDIESDDDVISTRDRKLEFSVPKDASKV